MDARQDRWLYPHPAIASARVRKRLKTGEMRRFLWVWFVQIVRQRWKEKGLAVDSLRFAETEGRKQIVPWQ